MYFQICRIISLSKPMYYTYTREANGNRTVYAVESVYGNP